MDQLGVLPCSILPWVLWSQHMVLWDFSVPCREWAQQVVGLGVVVEPPIVSATGVAGVFSFGVGVSSL